MPRPKKHYSLDECYAINSYIQATIKENRFIDLLEEDEEEKKAKRSFRSMISKGIDAERVTNWVYLWFSDKGVKRLNSNLRQAKYRQDNHIKTLKLSQGLISSIAAGARANKKSIEAYLTDLVKKEVKKSALKEYQGELKL
jgi:hypothetical protein